MGVGVLDIYLISHVIIFNPALFNESVQHRAAVVTEGGVSVCTGTEIVRLHLSSMSVVHSGALETDVVVTTLV